MDLVLGAKVKSDETRTPFKLMSSRHDIQVERKRHMHWFWDVTDENRRAALMLQYPSSKLAGHNWNTGRESTIHSPVLAVDIA